MSEYKCRHCNRTFKIPLTHGVCSGYDGKCLRAEIERLTRELQDAKGAHARTVLNLPHVGGVVHFICDAGRARSDRWTPQTTGGKGLLREGQAVSQGNIQQHRIESGDHRDIDCMTEPQLSAVCNAVAGAVEFMLPPGTDNNIRGR